MADKDALAATAAALRVLAHPDRLQLVMIIRQGRFCVGDLADTCGIRASATSEHLRLMETSGLLKKEREGQKIYYSASHPLITGAVDVILSSFEGITGLRQ